LKRGEGSVVEDGCKGQEGRELKYRRRQEEWNKRREKGGRKGRCERWNVDILS